MASAKAKNAATFISRADTKRSKKFPLASLDT